LVQTEGAKKAVRLKNPLLYRDTFPGYLIPEPILKAAEAVYFNAREYAMNQKRKDTGLTGHTIVTLKEMAPERINNVLELFFALILFFLIAILSRVSKIRGQIVVDKPRFISEVVSK
jgi:hypothetical protein